MSDHDLKWVGMDLDGTLFRNDWSADNPHAPIGERIVENVHKLDALIAAGFKIVGHTSRPWSDYAEIEQALRHHDIPMKAIVCGKLLAAAYVDDRAVHADHPDWLTAVEEINGAL